MNPDLPSDYSSSGDSSVFIWSLLVFALIVLFALWKGGKLSKLSIGGASAEFGSASAPSHAEIILVVCVPDAVPWWQVRVDFDGTSVADLNLSDRGGEHVAARITIPKPGVFHYSVVATGSRRGTDADGNPTIFESRSTGAGTINIVPDAKLVVSESVDISGSTAKFRLSLLSYENWSNHLPPADVQKQQLEEIFRNA